MSPNVTESTAKTPKARLSNEGLSKRGTPLCHIDGCHVLARNGIQTGHYGNVETMHNCPSPCYLYQQDPAGINSQIFYDWTDQFLAKTKDLQRGGILLLLTYDGYSSHIQINVFHMFKESEVVAIGMPAHTSHIFQSHDVSVISFFKAVVQWEIHRAIQMKNVLNCFGVGVVIASSYSNSFTTRSIRDGFIKTDKWNQPRRTAAMDFIKKLPMSIPISRMLSILDVMQKYDDANRRSLLCEAHVEKSGTDASNTVFGACLTAECILDALEKRSKSPSLQ